MNINIIRLAFACMFAGLALHPTFARTPLSQTRVRLDESIKTLPAGTSAAGLSGSDLDQPLEFMVALKMRRYDELLARIANGEIISPPEMAAKYYPSASDCQPVIDWLVAQGFTITKTDPNHLAVFVSGKVGQIQQGLQMNFAKLVVDQKSYTSATTAPVIPAQLAASVVGFNGLQPHTKLHKHSRVAEMQASRSAPESDSFGPITPLLSSQPPFLVSEILKAYNADGLSFTGAGEKIAIVIDTFPEPTDLTIFWASNLIGQSIDNIEFVKVVSDGTYPSPSGEETLDVEWTSGIASDAKVRVYGTSDLSFVNVDKAFQEIVNDVPTQPQMHQVSISLGLGENDVGASQLQTDAQYFAAMAANGLTVFVSSGDEGSDTGGSLQVSYFASDPNVTAVGGTSLFLSSCSGSTISETVWNGSGGGISSFFPRPVWQTGPSLPAGNKRLVPDIASAADPATGSLVILDGDQVQFGGTSWSAPVWAGFCALINQARSGVGLPPVGLLGPKIYPLLGTRAFRDIVSGNNGAYSAGIGYDLCTGIGVPSVSTLLQPLTGGPIPPLAPPPVLLPPYAQIVSPDITCSLPSSKVTFSWIPNEATPYWLTVGNSPGGTDIFNSSQTGAHSAALSNLPTDGRSLYVRLWSQINGTWYNPPQDYIYTAKMGGVLPPIIAPTSGTYKKKVTVGMASATPGATIFYTLDGSIPTTNSILYQSPFAIAKKGTTTLRATAFKAGVPDSPSAAATYTIKRKRRR